MPILRFGQVEDVADRGLQLVRDIGEEGSLGLVEGELAFLLEPTKSLDPQTVFKYLSIVMPRRWQNIAKYFFDVSKLIVATAVISQLVEKAGINWKAVVLGVVAGISFFVCGFLADRKGEKSE